MTNAFSQIRLTNTNIQVDDNRLKVGNSGVLYSGENYGGYITAANLNGLANTGYVQTTSGSIDERINNLGNTYLVTGSSGAFYSSTNPSNFITSTNLAGLISTGDSNLKYLQTGVSGTFNSLIELTGTNAINYSNNTFGTKINLENTGTNLISYITNNSATITNLNLTGYNSLNRNIAISGNLSTTGSTLRNWIIDTSGAIPSVVGLTTSGNLSSTGTTLLNLINGLSGQLDISGGNLQTQINIEKNKNTITGIQVTGSLGITGFVNLVGVFGTNIILSGSNTIGISGGSNNFFYQSGIESGVSTQFINFPSVQRSRPVVVVTPGNDISNDILFCQISGTNTTGFYANFSTIADNTGYYLNIFASVFN